jgi:hypothetical protein
VAASYLALIAFRALSVKLGWMTSLEARSFFFHGGWPETWLEPIEDEEAE